MYQQSVCVLTADDSTNQVTFLLVCLQDTVLQWIWFYTIQRNLMTDDHVQITSLRIHISLRAPNRWVLATEVTQDQMRWDDDHEVHIPWISDYFEQFILSRIL
jgi:hypothetical protein